MRVAVAGALVFFLAAPPMLSHRAQQPSRPEPNPAASCGDDNPILTSGDYQNAVIADIWPAFLPRSRGTTIAVGQQIKLILYTDGEKFQLMTNTIDMPEKNVYLFLQDLDDSCRLPPDPEDAFKLLKIRWEAHDISRAEFQKLHGDFMTALSQYVSTVQETTNHFIAAKTGNLYVGETIYWPIVYDNTAQHFEIQAWNASPAHTANPMIGWVNELEKAGEDVFQRHILKEK